MGLKKRRRYQAIEPDEILIDAQNLPGFDAGRLEGRIERPIEKNVYRVFLLFVALIGIVFLLQLGKLQVLDAQELRAHADANHLQETVIIAERGSVVDRNGASLALNEPDEELGFSKRHYPYGESAAHLIGYVSYPKRDPNGYWFQEYVDGRFGIEEIFNDRLLGQNGVLIRETTAVGDVLNGSVVRVPQSGHDITLSIDADLQQHVYERLRERAFEVDFIGGSAAIIDIETGELLTLASYPSFDPNILSDGTEEETIAGYSTDERSPYLDRAVAGLYTPGSVVKPFIALAALEEEVIDEHTQILSTGSISIPNPYNPDLETIFRDWRAHGWTDMREAIAVSSDVYFYEIGGGFEEQPGLGIRVIEGWLRDFGFGAPTGSTLRGEAYGVIPTPEWKWETFNEEWFLGNTYHTAIGQYGFQASTLQLARATAALANGGTLVTPTVEVGHAAPEISIAFEDTHLQVVHEGMRQAVTSGTAQALNLPSVSVAAKTGTAEVGREKEFINSLIVGFFPYENPKYAFAVIMERAPAGTTAGSPLVMQQVFQWMAENRPEMLVD